jgi:hypothetical protein
MPSEHRKGKVMRSEYQTSTFKQMHANAALDNKDFFGALQRRPARIEKQDGFQPLTLKDFRNDGGLTFPSEIK